LKNVGQLDLIHRKLKNVNNITIVLTNKLNNE